VKSQVVRQVVLTMLGLPTMMIVCACPVLGDAEIQEAVPWMVLLFQKELENAFADFQAPAASCSSWLPGRALAGRDLAAMVLGSVQTAIAPGVAFRSFRPPSAMFATFVSSGPNLLFVPLPSSVA
jgi:hypothetical protein